MGNLTDTLNQLFTGDFNPETDYQRTRFLGKGTYNQVAKAKSPLTFSFVSNSNNHDTPSTINAVIDTDVALSQTNDEEHTKPNHIGLPLLQRKKISSPFIAPTLYYSDNQEIHPLAKSDLRRYLADEKNIISAQPELDYPEKKRIIFGQLILGLECLHNKGIVHRDIKSDNILVTTANGKIHCQLADLDTVCEVNEKNRLANVDVDKITGSPYFYPPELLKPQIYAKDAKNYVNSKNYGKVNHKAVDIFALGFTFLESIDSSITKFFANNIYPNDYFAAIENGVIPIANTKNNNLNEIQKINKLLNQIDPELKNLIQGMLNPSPRLRYTVAEIKSHPYFIKNNPNFFADLANEFKQDLYVDSYYVTHPPAKHDPFLALPPKIKEIMISTKDLDNKMDLLHSNLKQKTELNHHYWQKITVKAKEILTDTKQIITDNTLKPYHDKVKMLNIHVREELRLLNNALVETKPQITPSLKINPKDLLDKVYTSINTYLIINKLDKDVSTFAWFNFEKKASKIRVDNLLMKIDALKSNLDILIKHNDDFSKRLLQEKDPTKSKDLRDYLKTNALQQRQWVVNLYSEIVKTLTDKKGGSSKQSLDTILQMHIGPLTMLKQLLVPSAKVRHSYETEEKQLITQDNQNSVVSNTEAELYFR